MRAALTLAALVAVLAAHPAAAQRGGRVLTLQQVEQRYPDMSPVHIRKCDWDGNDLYDQGELACVNSIYDVMYRSD